MSYVSDASLVREDFLLIITLQQLGLLHMFFDVALVYCHPTVDILLQVLGRVTTKFRTCILRSANTQGHN